MTIITLQLLSWTALKSTQKAVWKSLSQTPRPRPMWCWRQPSHSSQTSI